MEISWRVDDVVAYDNMREKAAYLVAEINRTTADREKRIERCVAVWDMVNKLDAYDRAAIEKMDAELTAKLRAFEAIP